MIIFSIAADTITPQPLFGCCQAGLEQSGQQRSNPSVKGTSRKRAAPYVER